MYPRTMLPFQIFLVSLLSCCATSVRITRLSVPKRVTVGDSATLECDWTPNTWQIYSLKWYFGIQEFYRWTPASEEKIQIFEQNAFDVDKTKSSKGKVVIQNVSRYADGTMRCEISEEAPTFHTTDKLAALEVVDLPDSPPSLSPIYPVYEIHQEVHLECSSKYSKPPADITFYVNHLPASPSWMGPNITMIVQNEDDFAVYISRRELRFRILPRFIASNGRVFVKCVAEIEGAYWEKNEVQLVLDPPLTASIMEGRSSAQQCSTCVTSAALPLLLLRCLAYWRLLPQ